MRRLKTVFVFVFIISSSFLFSQNKSYSPKDAVDLFKNANYSEALNAYGYLLEKYSRNAHYNYYYGACLVETKGDISEAVKRLNFSARNAVNHEVFYYLGRAFQLNYEFLEALKNYNKYKKLAGKNGVFMDVVGQRIGECETALDICTKYYNLTIVDKDTISREHLLNLYTPSKDVGELSRNSAFFEAGVDPNGVMFLTERGDEVYFSMLDEENSHLDIYKMVKLLDGWSDSDKLKEPLNSALDDAYPFVLLDGVTLFFASNREGGFGGYDIYKSTYDVGSKSFSEPDNLGVPFNSPYDDFLFVADEFNSIAWFASNREVSDGSIMVYKFLWDDSVVKNVVTENSQIKEAALLNVSAHAAQEYYKKSNNSEDVERKLKKYADKFSFQVSDTLIYSSFDDFKSGEALSYFKLGYEMAQTKDSLNNEMKQKRALYASTESEIQRNTLVNEILVMERQVYGYDDRIKENYVLARRFEQSKIKDLIESGEYTHDKTATVKEQRKSYGDFSGINKFDYFSEADYRQVTDSLDLFYGRLFEFDDIQKLKAADSLYIWANVLKMESSRRREASTQAPNEQEVKLKDFFQKKEDVEVVETESERLFRESKDMKEASVQMYQESMDVKYEIFNKKLYAITGILTQPAAQYFKNNMGKATSQYRYAKDLFPPESALTYEQYERVGMLKKIAVEIQKSSLLDYIDVLEGSFTLETDLSQNKKAESNSEDKKVMVVTGPEVTTNVSEAKVEPVLDISASQNVETLKKHSVTYKIQIGVFKNEPDANAISQIPPVSYEEIAGKGVRKYFSGSYADYSEAQSFVAQVRTAGFDGAFVVAFQNGSQISVKTAREIAEK